MFEKYPPPLSLFLSRARFVDLVSKWTHTLYKDLICFLSNKSKDQKEKKIELNKAKTGEIDCTKVLELKLINKQMKINLFIRLNEFYGKVFEQKKNRIEQNGILRLIFD